MNSLYYTVMGTGLFMCVLNFYNLVANCGGYPDRYYEDNMFIGAAAMTISFFFLLVNRFKK